MDVGMVLIGVGFCKKQKPLSEFLNTVISYWSLILYKGINKNICKITAVKQSEMYYECDYGRKSRAKKYSEWLLNRGQYEAGDIFLLILLILVLKA